MIAFKNAAYDPLFLQFVKKKFKSNTWVCLHFENIHKSVFKLDEFEIQNYEISSYGF